MPRSGTVPIEDPVHRKCQGPTKRDDPEDPSYSDSATSEDGNKKERYTGNVKGKDQQSGGNGGGYDKILRISGMMRAYQEKKWFSGSWHEDLDGCFIVFETMSRMWNWTHEEMLEFISIVLEEEALRMYPSKSGVCGTYVEAVTLMRNWYNCPDKRSRILTTWKTQ